MDDKYLIDNMSEGHVKIADDVIAKIATVATGQIDGVIGNIKDLKSGVADMLGVKTIPKNAKVSVGESEAIIDMYITVEYGKNIVDICNEVQDKVKENVETMTGLEVVEVNVHVIGISTPHSGDFERITMNDLSENTLEVNVSDRRKTRVAMIQLLFEFEVAKHENNNFIEKSLEETININSNSEYIKKETERIIEYLDEIDDVIVNNLKGWTISRLAKVDLSILRIAIYEFIYRVDIPHQVSINEAIEIAKKFSTEESSKFINGILGSVYRKLMSEKE